jgi:hypothetical protein
MKATGDSASHASSRALKFQQSFTAEMDKEAYQQLF